MRYLSKINFRIKLLYTKIKKNFASVTQRNKPITECRVMTPKSDTFHIIIACDSGSSHSFTFSRYRFRRILFITVVSFFILGIGTFQSFHYLHKSKILSANLTETSNQLENLSQNFYNELDEKEREMLKDYQSRIILLTKELQGATTENDSIKHSYIDTIQQYERQLASIRNKQEAALEQNINKLKNQNQAIESMMARLGVPVKNGRKSGGSGGPFIPSQPETQQKLLLQSEQYLELLKKTPLGLPTQGRKTSPFGHRTDPFTGKAAFHSGLDFEGDIGSAIISTANGTVKETGQEKWGYGNFVRLKHDNGIETLYAHLHKINVNSGDTIQRGQVIGQLGNSGRSTGPHLHYEILIDGQPCNPDKFVAPIILN
jgi:murein DD-endopeptidase MepM/ murein hydrolase activator NlpD